MKTIEDYWKSCEEYGFIKEEIPGKVIYSLPPHMGEGGFEIWGDTKTAMATIVDATLYKPWIVVEHVIEKYMQFSQFYTGKVDFYQKRSDVFPVEHGLNYLVHRNGLFGYKKVEAGMRILDVGIFYRNKFFDTLPFSLPEDFWENAANVLNPDLVTLPPISMICEQIRNCSLSGNELNMFVYGKAFEAFAITLNFIYTNRGKSSIRLSSQNRKALENIKEILKDNLLNPPRIKDLSLKLGISERSLMSGFKHLSGLTIYDYLKHLRMERAAELLIQNDIKVVDIARLVGYHGDGHFQRAFKDVYGTTPSIFRKEMQNNKNIF